VPKRNKTQVRDLQKQRKRQQPNEQQSEQPSEQQKAKRQKPKNKIWKRHGVFDTYAAAAALKNKISQDGDPNLEIKIKRTGQRGEQFQVKTWSPVTTKKKRK